MKRVTAAFLIAFSMLIMMQVVSFAEITLDENIDELQESNYLQPDRVYYFPVMNGSYQVEQGESTGYSYTVSVEPRNSGVSASLVYQNGLQFVRVSVTTTANSREIDDVEIILRITDRSDRTNKWDDPYYFNIGYGDTYFNTSDELEIFEDETVIEFSDEVSTCYVFLPDGSEFIANLKPNTERNKSDGIYRIVDFYLTTDMDYDVESKYGSRGALEYLRFYTNTSFNQSLLRIYSPSANYVYSVDSAKNLSRLQATRNGDFLAISTSTLGSYVLSDVDLGVAYGNNTTTPDSSSSIPGLSSAPTPALPPAAPMPMPSTGTIVYPPVTGGGYKPNPNTGAAA